MAVDYDLIVIGDTPASIDAAATATRLNARVALVSQSSPEETCRRDREAVYSRTLSEKTRLVRQGVKFSQFGALLDPPELTPALEKPPLRLLSWLSQKWAEEVLFTLCEEDSSVALGALGVDVVDGIGEFQPDPLSFMVNGRTLRSRAYLIAPRTRPFIPNLLGLSELEYLTPTDLWQPGRLDSLPQRIIVLGATPIAVELAQSLARWQREVTLVVKGSQILPPEDAEVSRLVRAQLEAEGVRVLTESPVIQMRRIQGTQWVQAGSHALETDIVLLAMGEEPDIAGWNLEAVGVKLGRRGVVLNEKLQTTNPHIYACGGAAGGYQFDHVARYEARIALKNALFFPWFKVDYSQIPWCIFTDPPLARVGLTEAQTRHRSPKDLMIVRQYFKSNAQALIADETTGLCKVIVRRNGEILGAHIVGTEAGELIGVIALAMRQKIKLGKLADLSLPFLTRSQILQATAREWQQQRLSQNNCLRNFLDSYFDLRRRWSK